MEKLDFKRIHLYRQGELNILLDINSGAVHILDELSYDLLKEAEKTGSLDKGVQNISSNYTAAEIEEGLVEIEKLIAENLLFSEEVSLWGREMKNAQTVVKALCLHIAHDCNLRCGYCFAGTGAFGGDRSLMAEETGKKAIDFLLKASGSRKHIEVDFFGGEPLMNFEVVKKLTRYGYEEAERAGKIIKFTLTTNGMLLNKEVRDFMLENNISAVLSLDGRPEVHDRMRPTPNNKGSYEICLNNFRDYVNECISKDYYLRGTYTRFNPDFSEDIKHIHALGFEEISLEPVVGEPENEYTLRDEDLEKLFAEYDKLAAYCQECFEQGRHLRFFHFNIDLNQGPCLIKRLTGCGAGDEYLAVSPQGELFPCHQFVGREEMKVGDVWRGIAKPDLCTEFREAHVLNKPECKECWARFYCSGGCHANNLAFRGSLQKPYLLGCELQKKRLECAIYLEAYKALSGLDNNF